VAAGVAVVSFIRDRETELFPVQKITPSNKLYEKWYEAVAAGDEKKALLYASAIQPDPPLKLPDPDYITQCSCNGIGTMFLTAPFNHFDFIRWQDAYTIRKIVQSASQQHKDLIEYLFSQALARKKLNQVSESMTLFEIFKFKLSQYKEKPYTSITDIWNKKYASLDEIFRLIAEIALQTGNSVQIVSIYTPGKKLLHTVCEIRSPNISYVCDPLTGRIWKNRTAEQLLSSPSETKGIWPDNINKKAAILLYSLPAEPADYRELNIRLYRTLRNSSISASLPCFGIPPRKRIEKYIKTYIKNMKKSHFIYWNFPFKSLKSSPDFPSDWILPSDSRLKEH
jgi:hypothetical protein